MKQLIPQNRIDEAASEYLYEEAGNTRYSEPTITKRIFNDAVQFTLNEIEPLMVECLEWTSKNYVPIIGPEGLRFWLKGFYQNVEHTYTTQQLLEEFIELKNKDSE